MLRGVATATNLKHDPQNTETSMVLRMNRLHTKQVKVA
jgi:hypothetical protein